MLKFNSLNSRSKHFNLENSSNISEQLELYKLLFDNSTEGLIIVNYKGEITLTNPRVKTLFGYDTNELVNKPIEVLIPKRYREAHINKRNNYNKFPSSRFMGVGRDLFGLKKNGEEFPIEISLNHFKHNGETYIMTLISDITERKITEKKIEILNSELELKVKERTKELEQAQLEITKALEQEKQLNELKSRFVSMASHEFRTPLSTISSSATLALKYDSETLTEKRHKHLNRIKSSVKNLTNILNDFLSLSKLEEGYINTKNEEFDVTELFLEIIDEFEDAKKINQTISYSHQGSKAMVLDYGILRNIVTNLLSNSIKYSNENGKIELCSEINNNKLFISIKDNGIGIPEKDQQYLFTRFHRASNATHIQGTGLGLNIVKRYLDLFDGNISFESKNTGTTFNLQIPLK